MIATQESSILELLPSDSERTRYRVLREILGAYRALIAGRQVLDFGCSWGTSALALLEAGATHVIGVEPNRARVEQGYALLDHLGLRDRITLHHAHDTAWPDGAFPFVLANGVVEHIPQAARAGILREVWRVVSPGGHFMIAETPNRYFPKDQHTTQLWFNHWLPERVAHRRAVRAGRFSAERTDWPSSGWRGMGYHELRSALPRAELVTVPTRRRHRVLAAVGLPSQVLDPWPLWVLRRPAGLG